MEILTGALWRGVYMKNDSVKESHVRAMAEYMDQELADVYDVDAVRLWLLVINSLGFDSLVLLYKSV